MAYLTDVRILMSETARDMFEDWAHDHDEDYDGSPLDPRLDSRWDPIDDGSEYIFSPKTRIIYSTFKAVELTEMFLMKLAEKNIPFKAIFVGTDLTDVRIKTERSDCNFWACTDEPKKAPVRKKKPKTTEEAEEPTPEKRGRPKKARSMRPESDSV